MTDAKARAAERAEQERVAWKRRELAKAGPLTQEQQAELRLLLLPPAPVARPGSAGPCKTEYRHGEPMPPATPAQMAALGDILVGHEERLERERLEREAAERG